MFVAQAHSFAQQARLAITLAWVAGYTNILTVLTCGTVTSHLSGSVSEAGREAVLGRWDLFALPAFLVVAFLAGAMLSGLLTELGRRRGSESIYVAPMAVQAILLSAFAVGVELHGRRTVGHGWPLFAMTGFASLAMGLQNATITRISNGVVRTTHMTGVVTDLGLETVQFLFWLRDRKVNSPPLPARALLHSVRAHPTAMRLALLASIVGSFALGAGLGTLAHGALARWAMFPPVLFLIWIIVQDLRAPICEIEPSDLIHADSGLGLPVALAVFHLRRDPTRPGRVHRVPDLQAWMQRVPPSARVVILDIDDAAHIDTNAAIELRTLVRQFRAQGRRLLLSGLGEKGISALRASELGDLVDPGNVCPDLDLAIARGLMLLDDADEHPDRPRG